MRIKFILSILLLTFALCSHRQADFNGKKAFGYLTEQCEIGYRNPGSTGHDKALQYYQQFFATIADTLILQTFEQFIPVDKVTFTLTNVIAGFNPAADNPLVIGAHWDTRPRADHDPRPANRERPILGANDGASGVAVLMHLGELIALQRPPRAVFLILFDGEDYGYSGSFDYYCMGSEYFARHLPISQPSEAIVIDMIGDKELNIPIERNSYQSHPELVQTIWNIAKNRGFTEFQHRFGSHIYDDHIMLIKYAGIPSIDLIDFEYPNRYQNFWHTTLDTPDKCSPHSLAVVGQVLYDYIYSSNK
jgi:glutaminyl-peptide cyclotransferase